MLGNENQTSGKLYILKPKTTDAEKHQISPVFQISEKNAETGKWGVTGAVSSVSGNLTRLEIKDQEYLGEKYQTVSVYLTDPAINEIYLLDLRLNLLSRSVINSLLNLKTFEEIKVSLYTNKKNGYPAVAVRQHGEMVDWAYKLEELPQPEEVTFKGKIQRDYSGPDAFFVEKVKELSSKLNTAPKTIRIKTAEKPVTKVIKPATKTELVDPDGDLAESDDNEAPF